MAINIKEFNIEQYRGIQNLSLKELNHINVFTGKNDTGKTSILELLDTLCNPLRSDVWQSESYGSHFSRISIFTELYRLFPYNKVEKQIAYNYVDSLNKRHAVQLKAQISHSMISQNELMRLNGYIRTDKSDKSGNELYPADLLEIQAKFDDNTTNFSVYENQSTLKAPKDTGFQMFTTYILPGADRTRNASTLETIIEDSDKYNLMLHLLKDLDSNITSFNIVNNEIVLKTNNAPAYVPLSLFGDGIKKAVDLATAALLAHNGLLLIDEFETSIHPSALQQTLRWVIRAAAGNNTQVFLTTHSLATLSEICGLEDEYRRNINIYTLYHNGRIRARRMNAATAAEVSEMGVSLL